MRGGSARRSTAPSIGAATARAAETTAVLVLQDGRIVAERYRADFDRHTSQRTWSVAKSMAATLIGVAVQDKLLDVHRPLGVEAPYRPGGEVRAAIPDWAWRDPRGQLTVDHLLRMSSGLSSPPAGNRTDDVYFGGIAFSDTVGALPLVAKPGTRFRYANNDTLLAVRAMEYSIGADRIQTIDFPARRMFWRIGMTRTVAETDWHGTFILSSQVLDDGARPRSVGAPVSEWRDLGWGADHSGRLVQLCPSPRARPAGQRLWLWCGLLDVPQGIGTAPGCGRNARQSRPVCRDRAVAAVGDRPRGFDGPQSGSISTASPRTCSQRCPELKARRTHLR
jgi:hypothetical protein